MTRLRFAGALITLTAAAVSAFASDKIPPIVSSDRTLPFSTILECVAFSPDGKLIAGGGATGGIKLWGFPSGNERATLQPASFVNAVAFSRDAQTLITATQDSVPEKGSTGSTIKFWNVATAQESALLKGRNDVVLALDVSPDGQLLASADDKGAVKLWSIDKRQELVSFHAAEGAVASVAFSPDGKILAVGEGRVKKSNGVGLWNTSTGKQIRRLEDEKFQFGAKVAYAPNSQLLATASAFWIKLWNLTSNKQPEELFYPVQDIVSLRFSPDGKLLAAGAVGGNIGIWDLQAREWKVYLHGGLRGQPANIAFSPDGRTLVSSGSGGVEIWDIPKALKAAPRE